MSRNLLFWVIDKPVPVFVVDRARKCCVELNGIKLKYNDLDDSESCVTSVDCTCFIEDFA